MLTTQAVVGGYDADGALVVATGIQLANGIDALYTLGEDDADEAQLGGIYSDTGITAALWAPTASNVDLLIYNDNKTLKAICPLTVSFTVMKLPSITLLRGM